MIDDKALLDRDAHAPAHVFADAATGRIRGWCATRDPHLQALNPGEVVVSVSREPNLRVDRYVDIKTGAMRSEP